MHNGESEDLPYSQYSLNVDQNTLNLEIKVDLEYLGYSIGQKLSHIGTTYVLNFEPFNGDDNTGANSINKPGICENRNKHDFNNKSWSQYWQCSDTPFVDQHIGNDQYLAYPPNTDHWTITDEYDPDTDYNSACTRIHYSATFSWTDLVNVCTSNDEEHELIDLETDNQWINVSGTFYGEIVSPLSSIYDTGYYRIYQFISHPFKIAISKSSSVISSTGINLFTMSLVAVYKQNNHNQPNKDDFKLIVLTESADYLYLSSPKLLVTPSVSSAEFDIVSSPYSGQDCLISAHSAICTQLWEIHAMNVKCPPNSFSGTYGIEWQATCEQETCDQQERDCSGTCFGSWEIDECGHCLPRSSDGWNDCLYDENEESAATDSCKEYIDIYGSEVLLSSELTWSDDICDEQVWVIEFEGKMNFYKDIEFKDEQNDYLFVVGEDRIYVEIIINYPSTTYSVFQSSLSNVWICSIDPDLEREQDDELVFISQDLSHLGCLNDEIIDSDGPYWIIQNYNEQTTHGAVHHSVSDGSSNKIRFSFVVPETIIRDTIYVHAQITLSLITEETATMIQERIIDDDDDERRRLQDVYWSSAIFHEPNLLSNPNPKQFAKNEDVVENMDQIRHFGGITNVIKRRIFGDKELHKEWNKNMLFISSIVCIIVMIAGLIGFKIHKSDPINWNNLSQLIEQRRIRRRERLRMIGNENGRVYYGHVAVNDSDNQNSQYNEDDDLLFSHDDGCNDHM